MDKLEKIIEGALFISGRWMSLEDLSRVCGTASVGEIKGAVERLKKEYEERGGGVILVEVGEKYRLEVSPDIRDTVYYLAPEPELSPALIKTLALIAYKQPIKQSKVVEIIGNRAYDYIKELRRKEFISIRKKGRTKVLSTTGRFRKYFALEGERLEAKLDSPILQDAQKRLDEVVEGGEESQDASE